MAVFPTTPKPRINGTGGSKEFVLIESKFEGNYSQTRRGATRGVRTFNLSYDAITNAEYDTLEAFFDANVGSTFTFVHPQTSVSYTVKFTTGKIDYKMVSNQRVSTSLTLVEA